jgi:hypothetical protein
VNGYGYTIEVKQTTVDYYFGEAEVKWKDKTFTEIPFEDDFSDTILSTGQWTPLTNTWINPLVDNWVIENEEYSGNTGPYERSLSVAGDSAWIDYELKADIYPIIEEGATEYWRAGIVFRFQDLDNFYWFHSFENGLGLRKFVSE